MCVADLDQFKGFWCSREKEFVVDNARLVPRVAILPRVCVCVLVAAPIERQHEYLTELGVLGYYIDIDIHHKCYNRT